jgi:hypothetical protein
LTTPKDAKQDAAAIAALVRNAWHRDTDPKSEASAPKPKQDGANPFARMTAPSPTKIGVEPVRDDDAGLPVYQPPSGKWVDHPRFGRIFEPAERSDARADARETRHG